MRHLKTLWRHEIKDQFLGSGLVVWEDRVVVDFPRGKGFVVRAIEESGKTAWEHAWADLAMNFRAHDGFVYTGGERARCVSIETGDVIAERDVGQEVKIYAALDSGPVYQTKKAMLGLHPENLSTLWEWPDPEEEFIAHQDRLCQFKPGVGLIMVDLATMTERTIKPEGELSGTMMHTHVDDLWCHFDLTKGHRTAIDTNTGRVVWHEYQRPGYGLITVDGERAYSPLDGLAAYELRTGRLLWHQRLPILSRAHIWNGRAYVGGYIGWNPFVFVVDCVTGELVLKHKVDFELSGLGFEPSPVVPMGENRIVVGTRREILCLELS